MCIVIFHGLKIDQTDFYFGYVLDLSLLDFVIPLIIILYSIIFICINLIFLISLCAVVFLIICATNYRSSIQHIQYKIGMKYII